MDTKQNQSIPQGFTLALALVDAIPVIMFCAAAIIFGCRLQSPVFTAGAVLAFLGGAGKVSWKLTIALAQRNYPWLSRQMRITMPVGFALMIVGGVLDRARCLPLLAAMCGFPSLAFVAAWVFCMCLMGYLAGHRNQTSARDNWIEQITNGIGQTALLLAVILA